MNEEEYRHWLIEQLRGYFHDFYMVEKRENMNVMKAQGFMLTYDYRTYDNHCKIYGYMSYGIDSKVLGQFVDILFKEYPLNKVFLETTDVDKKLLNAAFGLGFTQEALLADNRFINGQYHALFVLSLYSRDRRRLL
ncbi:MAG: GNAT family N-acetyltransferase [Eubacterium sp.]|nr:GNAT family N-acetyltransferase [Eubacterium sp.]